jgi:hypothetical protein
MKVTLLTFDKYRESPTDFEKRVNEAVAALGEIQAVKIYETDQGDFVMQLDHTDRPSNQELCVLAYLDMRTAEGIVNNTIAQAEADGKTVVSVDLMVLKTSRVLATILVRTGKSNDLISDSTEKTSNETQGEAGQQDQDADAKPKSAAKRRGRGKNSSAT